MFLIIVLTAFLLVSCSRVQDIGKLTEGELKRVKLEKLDGIPAEYGALVGVTANPKYDREAQLWFQDDNGTILVVSVGFFDPFTFLFFFPLLCVPRVLCVRQIDRLNHVVFITQNSLELKWVKEYYLSVLFSV